MIKWVQGMSDQPPAYSPFREFPWELRMKIVSERCDDEDLSESQSREDLEKGLAWYERSVKLGNNYLEYSIQGVKNKLAQVQ